MQNIIDTLQNQNNFSYFLKAIFASGLDEILEKEGLYTVLAPMDDAFKNLPDDVYETLSGYKEKAKYMVSEHILIGRFSVANLKEMDEVTNLNNRNIAIERHNEGVIIGGAKVIESDIECTNGFIQVVDVVMLP